jgi:hypothetical protein
MYVTSYKKEKTIIYYKKEKRNCIPAKKIAKDRFYCEDNIVNLPTVCIFPSSKIKSNHHKSLNHLDPKTQ